MEDNGDFLRQVLSNSSVSDGDSGNGPHEGVKALMLAVLEEALRTYFGPSGHERRQAEDWVRSRSNSTFSFVTVCETLGLDPNATRHALSRMKGDLVRPVSRLKNSRLPDSQKLARTA